MDAVNANLAASFAETAPTPGVVLLSRLHEDSLAGTWADDESGSMAMADLPREHVWDGPTSTIGWVELPTCSVCGRDPSDGGVWCPGPREER